MDVPLLKSNFASVEPELVIFRFPPIVNVPLPELINRKPLLEPPVPVDKILKSPLMVTNVPLTVVVAVCPVQFQVKWWNDCPNPDGAVVVIPVISQVEPLDQVAVGTVPDANACLYVPVLPTVIEPLFVNAAPALYIPSNCNVFDALIDPVLLAVTVAPLPIVILLPLTVKVEILVLEPMVTVDVPPAVLKAVTLELGNSFDEVIGEVLA